MFGVLPKAQLEDINIMSVLSMIIASLHGYISSKINLCVLEVCDFQHLVERLFDKKIVAM
jgi:hypothetical protein